MISFDKTSFVKFVAILDTLPDPVIYESVDGVYLYCNQAFFAFTGLAPEDILQKCHDDVAPRATASLYRETDLIVISTKRPYAFEHVYENHLGESRHFVITKSALHIL